MPPTEIRPDRHLTAPIVASLSFAHPHVSADDRARLAIPEDRLAEALATVQGLVPELAVISTCLRHEVIGVGVDADDLADVTRKLADCDFLPDHAEGRYGRAAVEHVFRVAAGFCSPVVGEPEVLGQVRRAHRAAREAGTLGSTLDQVFRDAIRAGREVRALLPEPDHGSLAAVAVDRLLGATPGRVAVVGAGKMANAVVERLDPTPWEVLRLTRRPERVPGAVGLDRLARVLAEVDAAVTAVTSAQPLLEPEDVAAVAARRAGGPLLLLDVGMPANVHYEPTPGVEYVGVDALAATDRHRSVTVEAASLVELRAVETHTRVTNSALAPLIRALRRKAERAAAEEIERALGRLGDTDPDTRATIEQLAHTLANRLLHDPLLYLSSHPQALMTRETARSILGLE